MKITRRTVLRLTGAAAASLALSSCSASGSAILGSNFSVYSDWHKSRPDNKHDDCE